MERVSHWTAATEQEEEGGEDEGEGGGDCAHAPGVGYIVE